MANIKQQKKRILVAERQRMENIRYRSSIKTAFRRLTEAVQTGEAATVDGAHGAYISLVDRAAARRALHPNTASRKKARATRVVARGPLVEETKKRRVTRKTNVKAVAKKAAVVETAADEAVVEETPEAAEAVAVDEAPVKKKAAPRKKPAAKQDDAEAPAAEEA